MDDERERVLAEHDAAWREMRDVFERLATEERSGQPQEAPVTLAQAIRHVADWDRFSTDAAVRLARGEDDPHAGSDDDDAWNARWLAADFYVTLESALAQLDEAHRRRRDVATGLDDGAWRRTEGAWLRNGADHYRDHARDPFDYAIDRRECLAILSARLDALLVRLRAEVEDRGAEQGAISLATAISHVAHWDESSVEVLDARRSNADAPDPYAHRDREWNERWRREDRDVSAREALQRLERASERLLVILGEIDERLWRQDGPRYALGTAEHYRSHTDDPFAFPLPDAAA